MGSRGNAQRAIGHDGRIAMERDGILLHGAASFQKMAYLTKAAPEVSRGWGPLVGAATQK